jgi:hypothetical protein
MFDVLRAAIGGRPTRDGGGEWTSSGHKRADETDPSKEHTNPGDERRENDH